MSADTGNMRLDGAEGLYLERSEVISFTFDGQTFHGYKGDTIASALAAHDQRLLSRSFKYHRPRGILSMSGQDANTLVQVGDEPNVRADSHRIEEGLCVQAQNVFGSLRTDLASGLGLLSRFLPSGFYYKTFYKPRGVWPWWERLIRRMAGLGKVIVNTGRYNSDKAFLFVDVAVIGAGPAGLTAALQAADDGAKVIIIDENPSAGGSLNYVRFHHDKRVAATIRNDLVAAVKEHNNIDLMTDARCTGWFEDNWLSVIKENCLYKIRAGSVVLASGCFEQPAIFRNNDLPGVMLASAAQKLIRLYGVKPGKRAVVLTANDDGYGVALDLLDAGTEVAAVVDTRDTSQHPSLQQAVTDKDVQVLRNLTVTEAIAGAGNRGITAVCVDKQNNSGTPNPELIRINCDLLCMSVGYTPAAQLVCHFGGNLVYHEDKAMLQISGLDNTDYRAVAAGSVNSVFLLDDVLADGKHAGWLAAKMINKSKVSEPDTVTTATEIQNHAWPIVSHTKGKEFVDFDEDLTITNIEQAIDEGYDDLNLVKRYSTVVMGPSQGRQSALNNLRIVARATDKPLQGLSVTTQRPPYHPEPIQLLAGKTMHPVRRSALHHRHLELGAQMMPAGSWLRPAYYGNESEKDDLIKQEVLTIRNQVGLIDVSTLGKLEVRGPDAAEFLNRVYTMSYTKLGVGRIRYVLMLDETGVIIDDGVAARLADDHFYVSTTTGGSDSVFRALLKWNAQWRLDVDITNVTSAFAAISIAGPQARNVLQKLDPDLDLDSEAFIFSDVKCGQLAGVEVRLLRVGFVGELCWEIHVPSAQAEYLWDHLMQAGKDVNIIAVGVEAQRQLRLEKGHIIVGQDTDGLTTPLEAGMQWALSGKKPFYIGKRTIDILKSKTQGRTMVGFTLTANTSVPEESNLTIQNGNIVGRVTSVVYSNILNKTIGLAYIHPQHVKQDGEISIKLSNGEQLQARQCAIPFYDPDGVRQLL